jgi:GalNAc-alpha-(1->4)-GalNAc-alpha-(1->3)-diNAcBac-PP-undecaprenol alpha-1,4-N-acetyl-D-galactosaminyltransferase
MPAHDVVLVISDLRSGGAQRVLVTLAEAWQKVGRHVAVITLSDPREDFFRLPDGVTRIVIEGIEESHTLLGGLIANCRRILRLRRALRQVGAPAAVAFVMPTAVLTRFASWGLSLRVVAAERNDPGRQSFGRVWEMLRRFAYPRTDLVIANSRGALASLAAFVPREKLVYAPNPLRPTRPQAAIRLEAPTVLAIGRLHRQKAHDILLQAFSLFHTKHSNWRLAIMGVGSEEASLRALAQRLGVSDRVDWLGQKADPYPWLQASQIFVLCSRYEGTPNALLEAMHCGLPCIVSDASPGPLDLIEDGVSGLVVPAEDYEALAAALDRLARDKGLAVALGATARERTGLHALEVTLQSWEAIVGLGA